MKRASRLLLSGLVACWLGPLAPAADYYVAQTALGADTGADAGDAHSLAWLNTPGSWNAGSGTVQPGDVVHLCGTLTNRAQILGSGLPGSPITVLFEPGAKLSAPYWDSNGALSASYRSNLVVDGGANGLIEATDNGTAKTYQQAGSVGVLVTYADRVMVRNLSISNLYVRTPGSSDSIVSGAGVSLSFSTYGGQTTISNVTVAEGRNGIVVELPGASTNADITLSSNRLLHISTGIIVGSGNDYATGRNVEISHNTIDGMYVWDGVWTNSQGSLDWNHGDGIHCWAVHPGSSLTGLRVHQNTIGPASGRHTTGLVYTEGYLYSATMDGNILAVMGTNAVTDGMIAVKGPVAGTNCLMSYGLYIITNNTFQAASSCIGFSVTGSTNVFVKQNVFNAVGVPISVDDPTAVLAMSDNNSFCGGFLGLYRNIGIYSLPVWQTKFGWDTHSSTNGVSQAPGPPTNLRRLQAEP